MKRSATISECKQYRYSLIRDWSEPGQERKRLCFCMLNPSTADGEQDDQTIRKCVAFAKRFGFNVLEVVNLFAYRATDPRELRRATDPVGPANDAFLSIAFDTARWVFCAWGRHGNLNNRGQAVLNLLDRTEQGTLALRINKDGTPAHPLYLPLDIQPALLR